MHLRPIPREQLEEAIGELADEYPKCFIPNDRLRLPLKIGIESDLRQDGADETAISAASFYMRGWAYLQCLQAGAERVDLSGTKAGVVTTQEASAARRQLAEEQAEVARRRTVPDRFAPPALLGKRTVDSPPAPSPEKPAADPPQAILELARLQKTLQLASDIAAGVEQESLRAALVVAALKVLVGDAERVIAALTGGST
jgi:sRNA-binding protein